MQIAKTSEMSPSQFWLAPDFKMGLHHFRWGTPDMRCLAHTHAEYEIHICLSGKMTFFLEDELHVMQAGDVLTIHPDQLHWGQFGGDQSVAQGLTLILNKSVVDGIIVRMKTGYDPSIHATLLPEKVQDQRIVQLAQDLLSEWTSLEEGYDIVIPSLMLQFLVYLLRNSLPPVVALNRFRQLSQLPTWQMCKAMEYMSRCGKSQFSLARMCRVVGTSPSRFTPLFRNSTSLNPQEYYNRLLIERAKQLFGSFELSTKEVAYELGFQNVSHFCKLFRALSAMTPRAYQLRASGPHLS